MTVSRLNATDVLALCKAMHSHLAGQPSATQGAVLADLLAMWLAGHHVPGDADATLSMRAELLAVHCQMVRQLVPINADMIGTTP